MREGFCEKEAMSEGLKGKKEQTLCTWGCPASSEPQIQSLRPGAPLEGWRGKAERQKQDEEPPVDSEIATSQCQRRQQVTAWGVECRGRRSGK